MTLGDVLLRTGAALNLATTTADHQERELAIGYTNEGAVKFLVATKCVKRTAEIDLVAGQGDYILDPDILAFEDLYVEPATGGLLTAVDSSEIRRARRYATSTSFEPGVYAYEADAIMLYPAPSEGMTLHVVYVPRPTAASDDDHDFSISTYGGIPAEYHDCLESYTKWKMADYADDASSQMGEMYKAQWEQGVIRARSELSKKGGLIIGRVRIGYPGRIVTSPGVDSGG